MATAEWNRRKEAPMVDPRTGRLPRQKGIASALLPRSPRPARRGLVFLAIAGSVLTVLTFVSPQVETIGRGLRTTLPASAVALFAIEALSPHSLFRALHRFRYTLLFAAIFVFQAGARFAFSSDPFDGLHRYVLGPVCLLLILFIVAALSELGEPLVERFRKWLLLLWGASLGAGVPALWESPGIARLRMARDTANEASALLAPEGVGEYSVYTAFAVCLPLLVFAARHRTGAQRWFGFAAIALAGVAVSVSTFTMAATLLVAGGAGIALAGLCFAQGTRRLIAGIALACILVLVPVLATWVEETEQIAFVVEKAMRLGVGVSTHGLERGEETMRGAWFLEEMSAFAEDPFFGYIPGVTGSRDNGHSSLSNSLVLFGIFGAGAWAFAIILMIRDSLGFASPGADRVSLVMAWGLFAAAGIMNPAWHSPAILGSLIAFGVGPRGPPRSFGVPMAQHLWAGNSGEPRTFNGEKKLKLADGDEG